MRIGPGEAFAWSPVLLCADTVWVDGYRGLWGLDTRDPFGGERAPSGPKYNRDGTVRSSWYDPLGWAGLDKVSPPNSTAPDLERAVELLEDERIALNEQIDQQRSAVRRLALEQRPHAEARTRGDEQLGAAELELHALARRASDLDERLRASRMKLEQVARSEHSDPRAHLRHKQRPEAPIAGRARLVELWSAISGGLLIATLGALVVLAPAGWPLWVLLALGAALVIEATAQHHLVRLLLNATIALAIVTLLVLAKDFWQVSIIAALLGFLAMLVVQNLDELRRA